MERSATNLEQAAPVPGNDSGDALAASPHPHPPRILAAIVNFNGAALTDRAVTSFLGQDASLPVRLVVIDDASQDDDVHDLTATIGGRAELILLAANRGYAGACNVAAQLAMDCGAEYTWLLNNDLLFEPYALRELVGHLELHPEVAGVAPVTIAADGSGIVLGAGADVQMMRGRLRHRHAGARAADLPTAPFEVMALEGACLLVRTEVLRAVGPLDEGFFMYWEDAEWSVRARRHGFRLRIVPASRVRHLVAQSSDPRQRVLLMIRNRIRFVRLVGSPIEQVVFLGYFLLAWLPAYFLGRLVPRFGLRLAIRISGEAIGWNVADAWRRRGWRLRPPTGWPTRDAAPALRPGPADAGAAGSGDGS